MKTLCDSHTSVDRMGSTIAVEHGTINRMEYRAEAFGIPGQERFSPLVQRMGGTAIGALLVVDATDSGRFKDAKNILEQLFERNIPVVIAANKQDAAGALSPDTLEQQMGVSNIPIVPTVATSGRGVFESFERLVDQIIEEGIFC